MTALSAVETVGVLGDRADALSDLVREHACSARTGSAAFDADVVVADGEDALYDFVRADTDAPLLTVGTPDGIPAVPWDRRERAFERVLDGDADTHDQPLLSVAVGDDTYRALADVTLVTTKPARISEYGIRATIRGEETQVDEVRADGLVVAAPAGTPGYASAADGPLVAPGVDAVSVVPIAPFRVERSNWVLPLPTTLTVEREEAEVSLLVDDAETCVVPYDEPVQIARDDTLSILTTPETTYRFV